MTGEADGAMLSTSERLTIDAARAALVPPAR